MEHPNTWRRPSARRIGKHQSTGLCVNKRAFFRRLCLEIVLYVSICIEISHSKYHTSDIYHGQIFDVSKYPHFVKYRIERVYPSIPWRPHIVFEVEHRHVPRSIVMASRSWNRYRIELDYRSMSITTSVDAQNDVLYNVELCYPWVSIPSVDAHITISYISKSIAVMCRNDFLLRRRPKTDRVSNSVMVGCSSLASTLNLSDIVFYRNRLSFDIL